MKIGVIGPSDVKSFCKSIGMDSSRYISKVVDIAKSVALTGNEILVVPVEKSISETFAVEYKRFGGKRVIGVIPMDDTEFGIEKINQDIVDEIINCVTWRNQPEKLAESSDALLCIGFGAGTLTELFVTKYFKAKVIVIEDFITQKLPREAERDLDIIYLKSNEVSRVL